MDRSKEYTFPSPPCSSPLASGPLQPSVLEGPVSVLLSWVSRVAIWEPLSPRLCLRPWHLSSVKQGVLSPVRSGRFAGAALLVTAAARLLNSMFHWDLHFIHWSDATRLHLALDAHCRNRDWCSCCCNIGSVSPVRPSPVPFPVVPQPRMGEASLCDPLVDTLTLDTLRCPILGFRGMVLVHMGGPFHTHSSLQALLSPKYYHWLLHLMNVPFGKDKHHI